MQRLQELNLRCNAFTFGIPDALGEMTNLQRLLLRYNGNLRFEVPTTIGQLQNLRELDLYATKVSGRLPTEIGLLSNLEQVYL